MRSLDVDGLLAILPADHAIPDVDLFRTTMEQAFGLARTHVVTLGIVPTSPETGYGYIKSGGKLPSEVEALAPGALKVDRFVEKPDLERARAFLAEGGFYWNSGIFALSASHFHRVLGQVDPYFVRVVDELTRMHGEGTLERSRILELLEPLPNANVDRAVMVHCSSLAVIPAPFQWSDVGTWDAVYEQRPAGRDCLVVGDVLLDNCRDSVVVADTGAPAVVVSHADDVVVVATRDAVLVTRRGQGQKVGRVVDLLRKKGRTELL